MTSDSLLRREPGSLVRCSEVIEVLVVKQIRTVAGMKIVGVFLRVSAAVLSQRGRAKRLCVSEVRLNRHVVEIARAPSDVHRVVVAIAERILQRDGTGLRRSTGNHGSPECPTCCGIEISPKIRHLRTLDERALRSGHPRGTGGVLDA